MTRINRNRPHDVQLATPAAAEAPQVVARDVAQPSARARSMVGTSGSRTTSTGPSAQVALQSLAMVGPKTKPRLVDPFWTRTEPVMVGPTGEQAALTFSHDSELGLHEVVRFLRSDAETSAKLDAILGDPQLSVSRAVLAEKFKLSEKQVDAFVIRRGVAVPKDALVPMSALNPRYLKTALWSHDMLKEGAKVWVAARTMSQMSSELLQKRGGLEVQADLEELDVELRHTSAEVTPSGFYNHMRALHATLDQPSSHLHVGIPSSISVEKGRFIAAAIEAKLVLQRLAVTHESNQRLPFKASLFSQYASGNRGMVKFEGYAFIKPAPAHDLEIRQWLDIDHGMELTAMAAKMAMQSDRLGTHNPYGEAAVDPFYGAVGAALAFVAQHLEHSSETDLKALVPTLRAFAAELPTYEHLLRQPMKAAFLEKVHVMLNETKLADRINAETFLAPA